MNRLNPSLDDVCAFIRLGFLDEARAMLDRAAQDAPQLNLLGVLHEIRREWKDARRYYGQAIRADRRYAPAQQNMRRLYELYTFGRCGEPLALGDERPALFRLLQSRS